MHPMHDITPTASPYRLSRYALLGDSPLVDSEGHEVALIYLTSTATLGAVSSPVAAALRSGSIHLLPREDVLHLLEDGVLVPEAADEVEEVQMRQRAASGTSTHRRFSLLPTSYCNMGCAYCGQQHSRGRMTSEHRQAVIARVSDAIADPISHSIQIGWFGAEPLMAYEVIRSMGRQFWRECAGAGKAYSSIMVTNGSLLDPAKLRGLVEDAHVNNIEVTLDGPEAIHDTHRPLKNKKGSFRRIVDALATAVRQPDLQDLHFTVRTNVDRKNATHIHTFAEEMRASGLAHPNVSFYLAPVHSWVKTSLP